MIDFFATKDCLSLFQRRNNKFTNKIDYLDNSNNDISELIFADINTFPNNNTTSAPTTFITHQQFETNNNHCIPGRFTGDYTTTSTATNTITTTTTTGYNHEFDVSTDISGVKGQSIVITETVSLSKCRSWVNDRNIKRKVGVASTIEDIERINDSNIISNNGDAKYSSTKHNNIDSNDDVGYIPSYNNGGDSLGDNNHDIERNKTNNNNNVRCNPHDNGGCLV